jgi:hypothetical protein
MMYQYRNTKTGEIKKFKKPNERLEKSKVWVRVGFTDKMMRGYKKKF